MNKEQKEFCIKVIKILLGSLIYSIAVNGFISPHHLLSGGVTGISLILQYISNIPSGYWVLIINIPIFIIGYKFVDRDFIILSFIGTISMSLLLILTKDIASYLKVDDIVISTIFGGVLTGIGAGIIFKAGASQGGTDIIAIIIRRKHGIKISTLYFILNGIIAGLGVLITSLKLTLYTLALMYIKSLAIDKAINAFNKKKILLIVTSKEQEVSEAIINRIGRGTTFLYGEGAYTGIKRKIIYCVVTENELHRVKKMIEEIDETALISISDAIDVQGRGFIKPAI
ncbi:YitT family protein [Anaerosalibacter bizertensis]|uniref:YitT family protein n=1 Tax=Anaerosalibacter bizertensis TaxID=932217 RepID=A0A844FFK5_9FIRM|nr:YitT family protein [Anaerosalibacter bizertensis]MBV1817774.1 YitT family protein [Bacteroidales bacterium MSK.15.36]MBU5293632.1 YitT family protein [Anaerosalibacter bizertensis]MCB5559035.1 YitT family protein [Anaerosalibacter bizertensis]MCG4564305.1 YitT family protein [Anaerosalibacter bizertensis]MCG4581486.1 YitT family protein [Anaerosalibacter bizertensis]